MPTITMSRMARQREERGGPSWGCISAAVRRLVAPSIKAFEMKLTDHQNHHARSATIVESGSLTTEDRVYPIIPTLLPFHLN
jgi:hypothetical protein